MKLIYILRFIFKTFGVKCHLLKSLVYSIEYKTIKKWIRVVWISGEIMRLVGGGALEKSKSGATGK